MGADGSETFDGRTAADLMLAAPKTLPGDVTVAAARELLDDPHVQMLLLADGPVFRGAITHIPDDADPGAAAVGYADPEAEAIGPGEPAALAFARTKLNPHRRIVVLDEEQNLLGLLCLDKTRTHFCRNRN
ncbi:MAG TPA: hypothetical protein VIJ70_10315 [Gaiellaceae bacterium]